MDEQFLGNELNQFVSSIKSLADLPEESISGDNLELIKQNIAQNFTKEVKEQAINQIVSNMEAQRLDRKGAKTAIEALIETLKELVYDTDYTEAKKNLIDAMMEPMYDIFYQALNKFHLYSIELPIKLEEGAQTPTYAHDTDAAADLYALEDTVLKGPSLGNKVRTGVSIQLPEGWLALIIPRSSIGSKTSLRLSNSVGLIDSGYRGELGVLYDNIDVNDYTVKKGDRIAQLLVMPSYRFQPKVVESLDGSDRGEGGFGSTGT